MARSKGPLPSASRRRAFLAQVGGLGAALAAAPLAARPRPAADPPPARPEAPALEGRIAFLAPGAQHQGFGDQVFAGLDLAFREAEASGVPVKVEFVRAATSLRPSAYRRAAASLLAEPAADLVVALGQPGVTPTLAPLFAEAGRSLVIVDGGANLIRTAEQAPAVFYNTLGALESCWTLGRWASRTFEGAGFLVASGFEGGHDALRAFRMGVVSGGLGEKGSLIPGTPLPEAPSGLSPKAMMEAIRLAQPSYVAVFLAGAEGLAFLRAFRESGLSAALPLIGSPYLAEEAIAAGLGDLLAGYVSASAWSRGLPSAGNRAFLAAYQRGQGQEASAFAALGYDTGRMLVAALQDGGGHARFIAQALERARWEGPGGKRAMDPASHLAQGDIHLCRYDLRAGTAMPALISSEPALGAQAFELEPLRNAPRPGVMNPYPVH